MTHYYVLQVAVEDFWFIGPFANETGAIAWMTANKRREIKHQQIYPMSAVRREWARIDIVAPATTESV